MSFACYLSLCLVQQVNESQGFSVQWVSSVCTALHFRPPTSSEPESNLIQKFVATNYIKSESNELLLLFVVDVVFVHSQSIHIDIRVRYCVRCQRRNRTTTTPTRNNVAVRPRCSRRRKYVTYANSYVALCTITGCLLAYAIRNKHTMCDIQCALECFFSPLFFGLLLFS